MPPQHSISNTAEDWFMSSTAPVSAIVPAGRSIRPEHGWTAPLSMHFFWPGSS